MKFRPKILITNDDGIHAPGIRHLWQALRDFADLYVIAPASEQSAVGLSITIRNPLHIQKVDWGENAQAWSVSGTPADCVKLALSVILDSPPDIIVSGINRGSNAGRNILYSGTVAGAMEAVMHDIPGIAFSCRDYLEPGYHHVEQYIPSVVEYLLNNPLPRGTLLNVNFPENTHLGIKGFKMTRQGLELWGENPDQRHHPAEGSSYYWMGARIREFEEHADSDIRWLKNGYMTAVPIHIGELTHTEEFEKRKEAFDQLFCEQSLTTT
ncbi:MAG: 5'/3'-nucleotidase SurE [Chlamydiales bacterium]|nr:5'/3'-nucleotidase SurE [Chlamydiia bacterium]MCP5507284.1 5'/3'-nucleotidase SurE [Chlamydiales bacterium]